MAASVLLERQSLSEFNHLARSEIKIVGTHARINIDLDLHKLARGGSVQSAPVNNTKPGELRLVAKIDVFANGQVCEERLLLKYHADALAVGIGRIRETGRLRSD